MTQLPFAIDNAIVRLQHAAQTEGEQGGRIIENAGSVERLRDLQQTTNKRRAELVAAILDYMK